VGRKSFEVFATFYELKSVLRVKQAATLSPTLLYVLLRSRKGSVSDRRCDGGFVVIGCLINRDRKGRIAFLVGRDFDDNPGLRRFDKD
jgi:hypothetical protein